MSFFEPTKTRLDLHVAVMPTRARRARDKAKVENRVLHAQRHILAKLKSTTVFGLRELNDAIIKDIDALNGRPIAGIDKSRYAPFLKIDRLWDCYRLNAMS